MKKMSILCLALCLGAALWSVGCTQQTEQPPTAEAQATAAPAAEETTAPVVYTEPITVLRLDSIDYNQEKDTYLLNVTPLEYQFEADTVESEQDVQVKEGEPKQYTLSKDAVIDFPMIEDLAKTVTLLPGELAEEYNAFVTKFDDKPLFIAEMSDQAITRLTYFYQP